MPQFNVHSAKTKLSQLLQMAERGEEVIISRNGKPAARLVACRPAEPRSILGAGVGDPNYLGYNMTDEEMEEVIGPLSEEELRLWYDSPIEPED